MPTVKETLTELNLTKDPVVGTLRLKDDVSDLGTLQRDFPYTDSLQNTYIYDDSIQAWLYGKTMFNLHLLVKDKHFSIHDQVANLVREGNIKDAVLIAEKHLAVER